MSLLQEQSLADGDVQQCPDAYHEALRERPVHFDERLGFFVCGRYGLMRQVLRLELDVDNDFAHHPSMILRGPKSLRVTFEPA